MGNLTVCPINSSTAGHSDYILKLLSLFLICFLIFFLFVKENCETTIFKELHQYLYFVFVTPPLSITSLELKKEAGETTTIIPESFFKKLLFLLKKIVVTIEFLISAMVMKKFVEIIKWLNHSWLSLPGSALNTLIQKFLLNFEEKSYSIGQCVCIIFSTKFT